VRLTVATRAPWRSMVRPDTARRARVIAADVAGRLRDGDAVLAAAREAASQSAYPGVRHWEPHGTAQGFAGLALLAGAMDECFPGESWARVAHVHLERAATGASRDDPPPGIFSGLSGVGFAASCLSHGGTRYARLSDALDATLLPQVLHAVAAAPVREPTNVSYFDAISGLSGVGAYLLRRAGNAEAGVALRAVLARLVALCDTEQDLPLWWTPAEYLTPETRQGCPHGNLNCGLAHGIPGPVALMSLAMLRGVEVPGLRAAIERAADWLCTHRADDAWGVNWPYAVPLGAGRRIAANGALAECPEATPSRAAWCYGSPGIANALLLAGRALGREDYRDLSFAAMQSALAKPSGEREIPSPTFCHGVAGLLQIVLRFAHAEPSLELGAAATDLCEQLIASYDAKRPLGYQSLEAEGRTVDDPGLLDGAAGVALVLLAASTDTEPAWDGLFLLS
jgi:hypothetical protein